MAFKIFAGISSSKVNISSYLVILKPRSNLRALTGDCNQEEKYYVASVDNGSISNLPLDYIWMLPKI